MLPYYKRSANFTPPNESVRLRNSTTLYNKANWSPDGGPLQVGYPSWVNPISSWIARGLEFLGLENRPGFVDGDILGYTYTQFSLDAHTQTRSSSAASFLRDALLKTTNLNVYKNTLAKKIEFDHNKKAVSVIVDSGGVSYRLNATKEIIVSAGAVCYLTKRYSERC